ncbi:MAG TPA: type II secretion system protein [Clostridiaceae bacterium]
MRRKSKKGNTLIELLAAMAILIIGLSGSSFAVVSSTRLWQIDNKKLDLTTFNQSISQDLKMKGELEVARIFKNNPDTRLVHNYYIYFNVVSSTIVDAIDSALDPNKITNVLISSVPSYGDCKNNYSRGTDGKAKYGALISIQDAKEAGAYYSIYKIDLTVWNLDEPSQLQANSTFYIGG